MRSPSRSACPAAACGWSRPTSAAVSDRKGSLYPEELLICIAARKLGRSLKWTGDRMEDVSSSSQAFDEIVDAEMGFDANGVAVALHADVLGDVGAYSIYPWTAALEPVQVVSFLPGPYKIRSYRGARARRRHLQAADRTLSRRRAADLDLRHGTADGHGAQGARSRSHGDPPPQSRSRRGISVPDRIRHRLGQVRLRRMSRCGVRGRRLRTTSRPAGRGARDGRLFGIGIACYAELTGIGSRISVAPGHADQHRHRDRDHPHRLDRRHHRGLRHRVARPGAGDDAGADHRRASRRAL